MKIGNFNMITIFFGIGMALLDIGMMSVVKITSKKQLTYSTGLLLSTLIYAPQPYLFLKALKFENMTIVNLIWNLSSNVLVTLIGVFYFGETIKGLKLIAICMALFSLGLFAYTD